MSPCDELGSVSGRLIDLMGNAVAVATPQGGRETYLIAYVARLRSLLKGMRDMCLGGAHDEIGTLFRTTYEVWVHALYLAWGGEAEFTELEEQRNFYHHQLYERFGGDPPPDAGKKLTVGVVKDRLATAAEGIESGLGQAVNDDYDRYYRISSFHFVHGHLGGAALYIDKPAGQIRLDILEADLHRMFVISLPWIIGFLTQVKTSLPVDLVELGGLRDEVATLHADLVGGTALW